MNEDWAGKPRAGDAQGTNTNTTKNKLNAQTKNQK